MRPHILEGMAAVFEFSQEAPVRAAVPSPNPDSDTVSFTPALLQALSEAEASRATSATALPLPRAAPPLAQENGAANLPEGNAAPGESESPQSSLDLAALAQTQRSQRSKEMRHNAATLPEMAQSPPQISGIMPLPMPAQPPEAAAGAEQQNSPPSLSGNAEELSPLLSPGIEVSLPGQEGQPAPIAATGKQPQEAEAASLREPESEGRPVVGEDSQPTEPGQVSQSEASAPAGQMSGMNQPAAAALSSLVNPAAPNPQNPVNEGPQAANPMPAGEDEGSRKTARSLGDSIESDFQAQKSAPLRGQETIQPTDEGGEDFLLRGMAKISADSASAARQPKADEYTARLPARGEGAEAFSAKSGGEENPLLRSLPDNSPAQEAKGIQSPAAAASSGLQPSPQKPEAAPLQGLIAAEITKAEGPAGEASRPKDPKAEVIESGLMRAQEAPISDSRTNASQSAEAAKPQAAPLRAMEVIEQIANTARLEIGRGQKEISIQLEPPHLGKVQVRVSSEGGIISARLEVSAPAVRDLLEANLEHLRTVLERASLGIGQFTVSLGAGWESGNANAREFQTAEGARRMGFSRLSAEGSPGNLPISRRYFPADGAALDYLA